MRRLKDIPLKYQLVIIIFLISLAGLLTACTIFIFYDRYTYKKNMEYELIILARIIANQSAIDIIENNYKQAQKNIDFLGVKTGIISACITDQDGNIIAMHVRDSSTARSEYLYKDYECLKKQPYISRFTFKYFDLLQPIVDSESRKIGEIHIRHDLSGLNKRFSIFSVVLFLIILLTSLVVIILSRRIQGIISIPISSLTRLADKITKGKDYSLRGKVDREDEIGRLIMSFNMMLDTLDEQHRDLLEAKQTLEERVEERTAKLKNINRELEAFTYSVSHDLRAPLRSIDGFGAALMEDFGDKLDSTAKDYLFRIHAASQRMGTLIETLLQLSRVSRQEINIEAINLSSLADDVVKDLCNRFPLQKVHFSRPDTLLAYGDKVLLMSVVENLLLNAWKFSSKLNNARVELGAMDRNGETVYFVRDNGAGFDMKYADKLFWPFQRLHSNDDFEGLGIGLATVARIIHRHGGEIWAEGIMGEGATFYFTLKPHI